MNYIDHRNLRNGDIVTIPGQAEQLVLIYHTRRLRKIVPAASENRIALALVKISDVLAATPNPVVYRYQVTPLRAGDDIPYVPLRDIVRQGYLNLYTESHVVYSSKLPVS